MENEYDTSQIPRGTINQVANNEDILKNTSFHQRQHFLKLGIGGIDSSSKNLEMSLWRKHSKIPVHFLSLTFGSNWDGDLPARFPRT
jgi:uncharacterized Fe-S center protein